MELTGYAADLVETARKYANNRRNGFPGLPVLSIPLAGKAAMNQAIESGLVEIVSRPGKNNPSITYDFLAPTKP